MEFIKKIVLTGFLLFGFFSFTALAEAADMYFSPATGVFEAGQELVIRVMVDPDGSEINAAEGEIDLSATDLEVVGISTSGSVFNLWTTEPFIDQAGRVIFGGGSATALSGRAGELFTLRLRAVSEGVNRLRWVSGAVIVADGSGQNIVSGLSGGAYTIARLPTTSLPEPEYLAPTGAPRPVEINSSTHPDPERWYNRSSVGFSWQLPEDALDVRAELNQRSVAVPQDSVGLVESLELTDILDGEWYFHIQVRNQIGWSPVVSRAVKIDTTSPEDLRVILLDREDLQDPMIGLRVSSEDDLSGIDRYVFSVDGVFEQVTDGLSDEVVIGPLPPGVFNLIVRAFDRAGNRRTETLTVEVEPIEGPIFTEYPAILSSGSILALRGQAQANSTVVVSISRDRVEPELFEVLANSQGYFTFVAPRQLYDGIYEIRAKTIDQRGAESLFSEPITVAVQAPGVVRFGSWAVNALSVVISLVALLVLLVLSIYYSKHQLLLWRRRLNKEVFEAEEAVQEAFSTLTAKVRSAEELLQQAEKKRRLTKEEKQIREMINIDLSGMEDRVEKEVKDIEDELNR